jgi:hypothetical protein
MMNRLVASINTYGQKRERDVGKAIRRLENKPLTKSIGPFL